MMASLTLQCLNGLIPKSSRKRLSKKEVLSDTHTKKPIEEAKKLLFVVITDSFAVFLFIVIAVPS